MAITLSLLLAGSPQPAVAADVDIDPYGEYRDEGETGVFQYDDSQDIPWIESETEILALPREQDLVEIDVAELPPGMKLLIDTRRISVNPDDRAVRLWLVLRSDSGVDNGSYEGFRCILNQYKVYAYATPRRTPPVSKTNRPSWRDLSKNPRGNYRRELLQEYFCTIRGVRAESEIRVALTRGVERDTWLHN